MRSWDEHRRSAISERENRPLIDHDAAFYAFLWNVLLVGSAKRELNALHHRHDYLPYLLDLFQQHFPEDIALIERYISPLFAGHPQRDEFYQLLETLRAGDENARPVIRRTETVRDKIKFKVGQVFQHKRFGYTAVVTGWDPRCEAGERWIARMSVDRLSHGRGQSFYHVL